MARRRKAPTLPWTPQAKANVRTHIKNAPMRVINARLARIEQGLRDEPST